MSTLRMWLARVAGLFASRRRDRELAEEFDSHLAMEAEEWERRGMTREAARRRALLSAGAGEAAKEAYRDQRGIPFIEKTLRALRHAARSLRRSPGYTLAVVLSLALGLGVNTAIFSIADALLRRPLPYPNESELVTIGRVEIRGAGGATETGESTPTWYTLEHDLDAWREGSRTIESFAWVSTYHAVVTGGGRPEYIEGAGASPNLLDVLGIQVARGRWFSADEVAEHVIVLSHTLSRRYFAVDSAVIGRVLKVNAQPSTVIGVMPPGTGLPLHAEFWRPSGGRGQVGQLVARPRAGVSLHLVRQELEHLSPAVANMRRAGYTVDLVVMPLRDHLFGPARPAVRLLSGAAALLLLLTCANVANLSLARTLERRRELAVRATLGASRRALASLVLAENGLLAVAGATLAVVLAFWTTRIVGALGPEEITRAGRIAVDVRGAVFAGGVAVVAALLISIAPAVTAVQRGIQQGLGLGGARTGRGRVGQRVRRVLVATQLGLALLLMTGAGLLIRSVARLTSVDHLGFSPKGVVIASLSLVDERYREEARRREFVRAFTARVSALPGVQSIGLGPPPLVGGRGGGLREGFNFLIAHTDTSRAGSPSVLVWAKYVDAGYLETFGVPIRAGRGILASDDSSAERVAVINQTAARMFFPDGNVVGRILPLPRLGRSIRVVGLIDDMLQRDLALSADPEVLVPAAQQPRKDWSNIAVRSSAPPALIVGALRDALRELDPEMATTRLESMDAVVDASLARHTFLLVLLGGFAGLALVLSVVGLYAVVSYLVAQRTLEIGVRLALGAQRYHVVGLVLGEGAWLVAAGVGIGLPAAFAFSQMLTSFLYEVKPHDTTAFATAPIVLGAVALIAAYIPARRAARVDPASTLRAD